MIPYIIIGLLIVGAGVYLHFVNKAAEKENGKR